MVDFASLPIPVVPYTPVCRPGVGMAMLTLRALTEAAGPGLLTAPHRLDFHQIMLVTEGTGTYSIDSSRIPCRRGTLLWTRPNQVVQSLPQPGMEAEIILFTEEFPLRMSARMGMLDDVLRPSHWQLALHELRSFRRIVDLLHVEFKRPDDSVGEELLKHLLAATLLRIDQMCRLRHRDAAPPALSDKNGELFLRFRRELDRSFHSTRLVEDYATALNCSPRALSRACRAVTDTSAKDLIDARVTLEARRLLAHTDLPIGAIARQLGFSEVTNFGKFFVRRVNMTPGAFRREAKAYGQS